MLCTGAAAGSSTPGLEPWRCVLQPGAHKKPCFPPHARRVPLAADATARLGGEFILAFADGVHGRGALLCLLPCGNRR
jgi:hypothetical protein